jgi:hypothetical protein
MESAPKKPLQVKRIEFPDLVVTTSVPSRDDFPLSKSPVVHFDPFPRPRLSGRCSFS